MAVPSVAVPSVTRPTTRVAIGIAGVVTGHDRGRGRGSRADRGRGRRAVVIARLAALTVMPVMTVMPVIGARVV